jgi:hypothetical protein
MKRGWVRRLVRIGLGPFAALVAIVVVLSLINPEATVLLALVLVNPLISNTHPPAIAQGQITAQDWGHWHDVSRKLTGVLEREFPVGTSEAALKSTLRGQGFKPLPAPPADCLPAGEAAPVGRVVDQCPTGDRSRILRYAWGSFPCGATITVQWTAGDNGAITHIAGWYDDGCL